MFPYPNWLQNHHFSGGISALCCSKKDIFRRLSGKWLSWEAQFRITIDFACILDRIFIIPRLILLQFVMAVCRSRTRVQDHEWQENLRTAIWAWHDHTKKEIGVSDDVLMTTSNGQGMPTKVYQISYLRLCGYDKHAIGGNKCTRSCRHPLGTSLLPVSSSHIAYTPEDNDHCILYRIHFLMISSCCNRRFYTACFCLPYLQQCAEAEIEGRLCCLPRRAFNTVSIMGVLHRRATSDERRVEEVGGSGGSPSIRHPRFSWAGL